MQLEIIDTVYIIAYLRPSDSHHDEAINILKHVGDVRKISQAALIELDLLMKSRGFTIDERIKTWKLLDKLIPSEAIEALTPRDFVVATLLVEQYGLDYFDALIAAQCIIRNAKPITTDREIIETVSKVSVRDLINNYVDVGSVK